MVRLHFLKLEPSPFTPLLSLTAYVRPKWQSKILISPGTNRFRSLFDIRLRCRAKPDAICCFQQGYGPSFDTFLTSPTTDLKALLFCRHHKNPIPVLRRIVRQFATSLSKHSAWSVGMA